MVYWQRASLVVRKLLTDALALIVSPVIWPTSSAGSSAQMFVPATAEFDVGRASEGSALIA